MNTPSVADINARLDRLESAVADLSRGAGREGPAASFTATVTPAAAAMAPAVNVAAQDTGALAKIRRAIAASWEVLEHMSA